jgi:ribonuclease H / adenosylcobalamin/alpha-ribazole phosphatase
VKNADLRPLSEETVRLASGFERVIWEHVPRERNRRADALANRAMDDQGKVPRPRPPVAPPPGPSPSPVRKPHDPEQLRLS